MFGFQARVHVDQSGLRCLGTERQVRGARGEADRLLGQRLSVHKDA